MNDLRVIPFLLLGDEGLVKTVSFKSRKYLGDPINAVKIFNTKRVDELALLDIDASRQGREPKYEYIKEIVSEAFMPITYGGGVTELYQFEKLFKLGVEKICVNSLFFSNPKIIKEASSIFGSQSIVLSLDVKKNFFGKDMLLYECGKKKSMLKNKELVKLINELDIGEIVLSSVDHEGAMKGFRLDLLKFLSSELNIPIISLGGAENIHHFLAAITCGASAVGAGSMFVYNGPNKGVLISYLNNEQIEVLNNAYKTENS
tara:strand:+ start:5838 stop:6617 length:780 start_codon:yes stop_codon:yes gene_type:complete